jgi:very-short-patch-repair endonuclease
MSGSTIDHMVRTGRSIQLHKGVYLPACVPTGWKQRVSGSLLACGPAAVASHGSAAVVWAFTDDVDVLHVTLGEGFRRRPGLVIHRTTRLDGTRHCGFRVTPPMRTLLDCSADWREDRLERAVDHAHRRGLIGIERFLDYLSHPFATPKPGSDVLRRIVALRDPRRPIESDAETVLLRVLRKGGLPRAVVQHSVRTRRGRRRIDFAYPDRLIAIEVDGFAAHGTRNAFESDRIRGNALEALGWHVLRFTWTQLTNDPVDVIVTVGVALGLVPVHWRGAGKSRDPTRTRARRTPG